MVRVYYDFAPDYPGDRDSTPRLLRGVGRPGHPDTCVIGEILPPTAAVDLPVGALVLAESFEERFVTDTATEPVHRFEVYRVNDAGRLLLYATHSAHTRRELFGKRASAELARLVAANPIAASGYEPVWADDRHDPNPEGGPCRWCTRLVEAGKGVGHSYGDVYWVEHRTLELCCLRPGRDGMVCAECGRAVQGLAASVYPDGITPGGRVQHHPEIECGVHRQETPEEFRQRWAEKRDAADARREQVRVERAHYAEQARQRRAARIARRDERAAAEAAKAAPVFDAADTGTLVRSKAVWGGAAEMAMARHEATSAEGVTGRWWSVRGPYPGEVAHFFGEAAARRSYRRWTWFDPAPDDAPGIDVNRPQARMVDTDRVHVPGAPTITVERGQGYGGKPGRIGRIKWVRGLQEEEHIEFCRRAPVGRPYDDDGRTASAVVVVVKAGSDYYAEEGMSFGVGDESGRVYWEQVRAATAEEAAPLQERAKQAELLDAAADRFDAVFAHLRGTVDQTLCMPHPDEADWCASPRSGTEGELAVDPGNGVCWWLEPDGASTNYPMRTAWRYPLSPDDAEAVEAALDLFPHVWE